MKALAQRITDEFNKGFDERNLRTMRSFYQTFTKMERSAFHFDLDVLSLALEGEKLAAKDVLYGGMCQIRLEQSTAGKANQLFSSIESLLASHNPPSVSSFASRRTKPLSVTRC